MRSIRTRFDSGATALDGEGPAVARALDADVPFEERSRVHVGDPSDRTSDEN